MPEELLYEDIPLECEEKCICGGVNHKKVFKTVSSTQAFLDALDALDKHATEALRRSFERDAPLYTALTKNKKS